MSDETFYGAEVQRAVDAAVAQVTRERDAWRIVAMTGTVPSGLLRVIGAEVERAVTAERERCAALLEQAAEEREMAAGQTDDIEHHDLCTRAMHLRGAALIVRTGETWPKVPARADSYTFTIREAEPAPLPPPVCPAPTEGT